MQEKREQRLRQRQVMREDLVKELQKDSVLQSTLASNDRVENMRRLRKQKVQEEEKNDYEALIEVTVHLFF
jgi:hypothetical protein